MLRRRVWTCLIIIALFGIIGALGSGIAWMRDVTLDSFNQSNLIRLRVVANSDSPFDQRVKLKVRDRIIKATELLLLKVQDPAAAEAILVNHLGLIRGEASRELAKNGVKMPVKVSMGKFDFPNVNYPFGTLPAGEYKGVKVVLGAGEGRNWWCVLYPPLCLLAPDAPGFRNPPPSGEQPPKVEYRLALLEAMVKEKGLSMNQFWVSWGKFFGLM